VEIRRLPGDQDTPIGVAEVQEFDPEAKTGRLLQASRISEFELGELGIRFAIVAVITATGAIGQSGERRYQKQ